jgi:uncharacterized RmlC-like cupin family protein
MTNATAATVESEFPRRVVGPRTMPKGSANPASLDDKPSCRIVGAGAEFVGKRGHLLAPGISAQSVGAQRIHLQIGTIPPGVRSKAHKHADHETAIYVLRGGCAVWCGEKLEQRLELSAGDFLYIPARCRQIWRGADQEARNSAPPAISLHYRRSRSGAA